MPQRTRRDDRIWYTGRALTRGVLPAKVVDREESGVIALRCDVSGEIFREPHPERTVFENRMDALRSALGDVSEAESAARALAQGHATRAAAYRALMDEILTDLYPQHTIGAQARIS